MARPQLTIQKTVNGFPAQLDVFPSLVQPAETDLALACYVLLKTAGMNIRYSDVDLLSGIATQFLYLRDQPECVQLGFVPPVETLFKLLGAEWKEITPSGPDAAYSVVAESTAHDHAILARLKEPLIIFGHGESLIEKFLFIARAAERCEQQVISLSECDRDYWRYPLDEGNTLVLLEHVPRDIPRPAALCHLVAERAVRSWKTVSLAGCAEGSHAYEAFASDLRDTTVDFTRTECRAWTGKAMWRQWTARASCHDYFDRMAPRFGGAERAAYTRAAFCYAQVLSSWHKFGNLLGPTWDFARTGFREELPPEFAARWCDMTLRTKAAAAVDTAREWENKAVIELLRVIA